MKNILLSQLPINQKANIENLNCEGLLRRRLLDLGIVQGTKIIPLLKSPSGDPTAFEIRGTLIALRKEMAETIEVSF